MSDIDPLVKKIASMPPGARAALEAEMKKALEGQVGLPQPGPQLEAYFSKADVLLFGGCVSGDTEYLTETGWKRIDAYDGSEVAQWDKDTGSLSWAKPVGYTKDICRSLLHFENSRVSMVLSDKHRMPLYDWKGEFVVKSADEVALKPSRHVIPTSYTVDRSGLLLTDNELRLAVAIHADGNLYIRQDQTAHCRISVRKQRKKDRLLWLFAQLGIEPHVYKNPKRPTEVRYGFNSPVSSKKFSGWWWRASQRQLEIILEEISYWDGNYAGVKGGDICYTSAHWQDADFIQYAAHACGRYATLSVREKREDHHAPQYRVHISKEGSVKSKVVLRGDAINISRVEAGYMYCFKTETSFWLARHNGKIFITGNSPGGGKSVLCILLALNEHYRSLIVRSAFTDLRPLIDNAKKIVGNDTGFVGGSRPLYKKKDGGVIHFMGLPDDGGVGGMQGEDHDLICVDEAATVTEDQARLIMGWLRTEREGQRCRVVMASNPPLDSTGDWLVRYFAPWLDKNHPSPAEPGELRWFLPTEDSGDVEVEEGDFTYIDAIKDRQGNPVKIMAESRTFIPSKFTDNKYYSAEEYAKRLAGLPEEARKILASGDFMAERTDDMWQLIPTSWVKAAVERWKTTRPYGIPMSAVGTDVAQGGADSSVIANRYDYWIGKLLCIPGSESSDDGSEVAAGVVKVRKDQCEVTVDMGGGYGAPVKKALADNGIKINEYKGKEESLAKSETDKMGFFNKRTEIFWRLREAFDPSQPGGAVIAIPDDPDLISELTAIRYVEPVRLKGIQCHKLEDAKTTKKRFGRSIDRAYAVALCWWKGPKGIAPQHPAKTTPGMRSKKPVVKVGYAHRKRRRR